MPVPCLVRVPAPVPMTLAILLPVAAPPRVRPKPEPVIVPAFERMMLPLLATMLLALPSVTNPIYVPAVALLLVRAPPLLMPVPFKVSAFVFVIVVPFRSKTPPLVTLAALVFPPKAFALPIFNRVLMVVPPV